MKKLVRLALVVGTVAAVWAPANAGAHPLGNFTVNAYSGLEFSRDAVAVHYALDLAEIPTFQLFNELDIDGDVSPVETRFGSDIPANLWLESDGERVPLELQEIHAVVNEGQAGLQTLRVDAELTGDIADPDATISFRDRNFADRVGWREIVIDAIDGQGLRSSSAPDSSVSDELRDYPTDLLSSPPHITEATARLHPGALPGSGNESRDVAEGPSILRDRFASLIERSGSPWVILVAILLAFGAGALHALGPGHGKTVMAAYLVGAEGRARQAVVVGTAVSLMHTTSVVVLGLITLWASNVFAPEAVYPWLALASGAVVLGLGLWLLRARTATRHAHRVHEHDHHEHDHHQHPHDHDKASHARAHALGLDHDHGHLPDGVRLTSWKGLGAIAVSGGILPSPTALVVLLGAVALHRVVFGIALVGAFSVGLAAALTGVGLVVLKTKDVLNRRSNGRITRLLPVMSAAAIVCLGLFLTGQAVVNLPL
ncbi:MAG TPA: high-affinity nickel-transporter [Actinomycetota bacterium]|nr:high-affinity nickel-transporter [Actinomycetota bacterium]